jgi:hypothetical protein
MNWLDLKKREPPVLLFVGLGLGSIAAYEIFRRKIQPKVMLTATTITTRAFAEKYKLNRKRAKEGDPEASKFIQLANHRLRELHDDMTAQRFGADDNKRLLLELSRLGVTLDDYLK